MEQEVLLFLHDMWRECQDAEHTNKGRHPRVGPPRDDPRVRAARSGDETSPK